MTDDKRTVIEHGILDLINNDGKITQTEISASLRVSIGLVNAYLKNLVKKGYVKVSNVRASTVKYMLTSEGMAEKYRLTRSYMAQSLDHYRNIKQAVEGRIVRLKLQEVRTVVFVGAGEISEIMHLYLGDTKIQLLGVFDNVDLSQEQNNNFFGFSVQSLNKINKFVQENNVEKILINEFEEIEQISSTLISYGVEHKLIEKDW